MRAEMIEKAMEQVPRIHAKIRIAFGLKHVSGPMRIEQSRLL